MAEQDELVAEAERETATDLLGAPLPAERGPGRPAGSQNQRTRKEVAAIRESGQSPLAFLASVWRNPSVKLERRTDAAKAALPYMHRKQPVAIEGAGSGLRVAIIMPGQDAGEAEFLELDADDLDYEEIQ